MAKYVHVQSILPQKDVIALKEKSGESSIKEAVAKAVYYYLKHGPDENETNAPGAYKEKAKK